MSKNGNKDKKKVTIYMNTELWKLVKIQAVKEGKNFTSFVSEMLKERLGWSETVKEYKAITDL